MAKYNDDVFIHLESDIDKMRTRFRQYISYSNSQAATAVILEILYNAIDECKNPNSPADKINIIMDERDGCIIIEDNGRGIPTNILEKVFTSLNMGSNIDTSKKAKDNVEVLGQNGVGTLAAISLAEKITITSYRGGSENLFKTIIYEEGKKVHEESGKCKEDKHGLYINYKPSKVLGKDTKIVWNDIHKELLNLQYLNKKKIKIKSLYVDKKGNSVKEEYKQYPFEEILSRNNQESIISNKIFINVKNNNVEEEIDGRYIKRFIDMDLAFQYTNSLSPYIDSFSNSNNTVDNGDHLDASLEALCRYLQNQTKNSMSDKEKEKLDIKWDDVKAGLSICVALRSNFERLYTGQTKHKIVSAEIKKIIINLLMEALPKYFESKQSLLKDLINIVKTNARARREGDKVKNAVVKGSINVWSAYKMDNYDPCTNKGKEYKELFIIEGKSARGSLKQARDAHFQALYSIRGVSANIFKMTLDQIVGPKGNKEFTDLITIMACNVGLKFDLEKLQFNKIVIASDADKFYSMLA